MKSHIIRKLSAGLAALAIATGSLATGVGGVSRAHAATGCGSFYQDGGTGNIVNGSLQTTGQYRLYRQTCSSGAAYVNVAIHLNPGIGDATVNVYSGKLGRLQTTTAHYPVQLLGADFNTSPIDDCYPSSCSTAGGTTSGNGSWGNVHF